MPAQLKGGPRLVIDRNQFVGADAWRSQLLWSRDGMLDCRENVIYILRDHPAWAGVLAVDDFAKRLVFRKPPPIDGKVGEPWTGQHDSALGLWLCQAEGLRIRSTETMATAAAYVGALNKFHPLREYLDGLVHDGTPRLDTWAARYLGAEASEYASRVGRYFLLNMVRRAFEPGCIMRSVPVLEGRQNIGKSRALRTLAHPYFSDTPFKIGEKDSYQQIQGIWLYEIAELQSFRGREAEEVKAFVSSTRDRFRAPYARAPEDHDRQTVFAATTNVTEWARDYTGSTRFWPLALGQVDLDALAADRDQLLAEAVNLYRAGGEVARAYPTADEEKRLFAPQQALRLSVHPWVDVIAEYLDDHPEITQTTTRKVLEDCLGLRAMDMGRDSQAEQRVSKTLAILGWRLGWHRPEGSKGTAKCWRRPEAEKVDEPAEDDPPIPF